MGRQGWPAFKEEEATRSDEMTESWGVALIYVRRSMVRYDEDRVSAQRRRGRAWHHGPSRRFQTSGRVITYQMPGTRR